MAGAFIERLVAALAARGHTLRVLAPADAGVGGRHIQHEIPVTRVRYAPARWETLAYRGTMADSARSLSGMVAASALLLRQRSAIIGLWRQQPFDLVHAHWWIPAGLSALLAQRPYVLTLHGTDVGLLESSKMLRVLAGRVLRNAAAVTAVSTFLAARAARATGLDASRIHVQPMPVDGSRFVRRSSGGGGVVTVGRLTQQKRLDLLLDAMAHLRNDGRPLPLTVVGDGEERPSLEHRAQQLGLAALTRFVGAVPPEHIATTLGDADVFAFPAVAEGFGLAAAEALLLGIPVVAARDGGGVTDFVPSTGAGRLVAATAPEFARAIDELVRDPDSRDHAATAGADLRARLDPQTVAERFEAILGQALDGR
ncbi:MAG TPA: glycosyltransferase [Gemmatimonadales bacterium]|nr:glycosyltransferase [Gemmatimonadales bacterium]